MEDAWQIFEDRHQVRFYDHEKVPSKELIEKVLHKAHDLVPSKQKLMPYVVKILGPEHKKIKMHMYELASEVDYPDLNLRNKYRLDLVKEYENNNIPDNHRWIRGNSQLFAPYILLLVPRKAVQNTKLTETYKRRKLANYDGDKLSKSNSNIEIGMFSIVLTYVAMKEGLSIGYTTCLNHKNLSKHYNWLKKEEVDPTIALSLGYVRPDTEEHRLERQMKEDIKGRAKPEKHQTFEWI
jgi:hypothetical protein|tara:strand:+ start:40 stop:753 length:714 start_codon:yes stop_codon:yes gene_type:complete